MVESYPAVDRLSSPDSVTAAELVCICVCGSGTGWRNGPSVFLHPAIAAEAHPVAVSVNRAV